MQGIKWMPTRGHTCANLRMLLVSPLRGLLGAHDWDGLDASEAKGGSIRNGVLPKCGRSLAFRQSNSLDGAGLNLPVEAGTK
jgi:hypothetical protein